MGKSAIKFGYVESVFSYGKCGFVRELCGEKYYFNSKSFSPGRRRMKFGEPVRFQLEEITDEETQAKRTIVVGLRSEINPNGMLIEKSRQDKAKKQRSANQEK